MTILDELEKLLAATQGEEWRVSNRDPVRVVDGTGAYIALCDPHHKGDPLQETRAALICAAINALPGLLESARRVERLEAALQKIADPQPTFAGPPCCGDTFADACELFGDIAATALKGT
jgi:hypothetical protein